jgi:hypothetical protein
MEETQQLIEALAAQDGIPMEVSLPRLSPFAKTTARSRQNGNTHVVCASSASSKDACAGAAKFYRH